MLSSTLPRGKSETLFCSFQKIIKPLLNTSNVSGPVVCSRNIVTNKQTQISALVALTSLLSEETDNRQNKSRIMGGHNKTTPFISMFISALLPLFSFLKKTFIPSGALRSDQHALEGA